MCKELELLLLSFDLSEDGKESGNLACVKPWVDMEYASSEDELYIIFGEEDKEIICCRFHVYYFYFIFTCLFMKVHAIVSTTYKFRAYSSADKIAGACKKLVESALANSNNNNNMRCVAKINKDWIDTGKNLIMVAFIIL